MSIECVNFIAVEPKICVDVFFSKGDIEKISLSNSKDGFICQSHGEGSVSEILEWLKAYSEGKQIPMPFLFLKHGYSQLVLEHVMQIPFGETATYAEIARRTGNPLAARAVGNACRDNPYPLLIPCHRVLHTDKKKSGYAFGTEMKNLLLSFECREEKI